jgi:hypothetical protein
MSGPTENELQVINFELGVPNGATTISIMTLCQTTLSLMANL